MSSHPDDDESATLNADAIVGTWATASPQAGCCWPGCVLEPEPDLPLCETHYREVGLHFISNNTAGGSAWQVVERRQQREAHERLLAQQIELGKVATAKRQEAAERSVVYYVRTGHYVKIGYTSDLKRRLSSLRLDATAVLATEPGGRALEAQRHTEFTDERIDPRREDFALSMRLEEHIRELQETGPAGPTTGT